jgi:flavin-dependent dehydrogenase
MQLPTRASYVVIGAGIHGLSTAWHLAKESKARGRGSGEEVIDNAYVIADSNHGYKMVGALVAKELMDKPQDLLEPFRFSRYETGELHPTSHSPFPWN